MATQTAAGQHRPALRFSRDGEARHTYRLDLHYLRASGLAQARLQLAVLSGNRRRALEQLDRLVGIDRELERMAAGDAAPPSPARELEAELTDQRLAIASEKLALTSVIELPRLEPIDHEVLLARTERLYDRILHLDRRMYLEAVEDAAPHPVLSQFEKLQAAFG